jgi:glycosyltransferase involved in cell wall biosynthesis
LLKEIGPRVDFSVVTLLETQRTDWLAAMIRGERDRPERYEVDGREVTAIARWPASTRAALTALAPAYHLPGSPAPWLMGGVLAPHLDPILDGTQLVHNVFMGREAFSAGFMIAAHKRRLPFVFTPLRHKRPLGWNSPAFRRLYSQSDAVVALTHGEADWLATQGAPRSRLHVIGLGPQNDPTTTPDLARQELKTDQKVVLFIGQLHAWKGFRALLDAAGILSTRMDTLFVFAGPDVRGNASAFAGRGPNVKWLGPVSPELRDSLLSACTVLCVPSSQESFGSVVVEAWACGKPVIGGPAEATSELIADGVDGFTVPQDPSVIAERLTRILDDPGLARSMGDKGKEKVRQKYAWDAIAEAHLAIYRSLIA